MCVRVCFYYWFVYTKYLVNIFCVSPIAYFFPPIDTFFRMQQYMKYNKADRGAPPPRGLRGVRELPEGHHRHQQVRREGREGLRKVRRIDRDLKRPLQYPPGED